MEPTRFINRNKKKFDSNRWNSICYRYFMFIQYICFKILGLAPWTLNMSKVLNKNQKVRFCGRNICSYSYIGSCYNITVVIICLALNFNFFVKQKSLLYFDSQLLPLVLARCMLIFSSLTSILNIIVLTMYQKSFIKIINKFENMNKKLRLLNGSSHSYEPEFDFTMCFQFIFNFFVIGISAETEILRYFKFIAMIINHIVVDFVTSGIIMQYTIFLTMIIKRFEKINSALSKLLNTKIIANQVHSLSTISTIQSSISSDLILHRDLNNIISAYVDLCEICEDLQDIYGFPVLISTVTLSMRNTFHIYLAFLVYFFSPLDMKQRIYGYLLLLLWCIFLLIVLTSRVTKAVNQV